MLRQLEEILIETNYVKHNLNIICDNNWSLLCSRGNKVNGSFQIEKHIPTSDKGHSSEGSSSDPPPQETIPKDVADLIAYGQFLLNRTKLEITKKKPQVPCKGIQQHPLKMNIMSNTAFAKSPTKVEKIDNVDVKTVKKSSYTPTKQTHTSQQVKNVRVATNQNNPSRNEEHSDTFKNENAVSNKNIVTNLKLTPKVIPIRYKHSCSLKLSDTIKTLTIPDDLLHLLKQYYYYESNKFKHTKKEKLHNCNAFKERFSKQVKSRLENDLKSNVKEVPRYMRYLDVAEGVCQTQKEKDDLVRQNSKIQYKSCEQLCLYETKYHQLMELQLQSRLMDSIAAVISESSIR